MIFKDQSVNELTLNLIPYDRDISDLMVLVLNTVSNKTYHVEYGIIGASHFVKVSNNSTHEIMMEVFACVELAGTDINSTNIMEAQSKSATINSFKYEFHSTIIDETDVQFQSYFDHELAKSSTENGLSYIFPRRDDDSFTPLTTISLVLKDDMIHISTMHAYPNEGKITITKTKII